MPPSRQSDGVSVSVNWKRTGVGSISKLRETGALPQRHRRGYALLVHHDLPDRPAIPARQFPATPTEWLSAKPCRSAPPPSPYPPDGAGQKSRGVRHRFLAYTFPSRSPSPVHPAVLDRPHFVAATPALPDVPRIRLPPASPRRYDGKAIKVSHLHPKQQRLVAHHRFSDRPDCYSKKVVGWSNADHMRTELVETALKKQPRPPTHYMRPRVALGLVALKAADLEGTRRG